ncbi:MAG: NAD(P)H-dependent glycerol-3-phosphate dehydrogenase [bacterium]
MPNKIKVAVLGAGNMGTAMAQVIAKNGFQVSLWNHAGDLKPLEQIKKYGENKKYLPKVKLSGRIRPEPDMAMALDRVEIVFFVVPSSFMESVVKQAKEFLSAKTICVDVSKGIDEKSLGIIPDIIKKNLSLNMRGLVATVSGPAIANDMARAGFTAMNVASKSKVSIKVIKQVLENDQLKLLATDDIVGIEVTGSFKNVYAIAMGLCDGFGLPMNTKAALLVFALQEIGLLVKKMGGQAGTVYDLAGLGDLIGTGLCVQSRNRSFGEYMAKGYGVDKALSKVGQVVEGVQAAKVLHALGLKYKLKTPFAEMIYTVSSGQVKPRQALNNYLKSIK